MNPLGRNVTDGAVNSIKLKVEPVAATFDSSALQSSWIQRLKPSLKSSSQQEDRDCSDEEWLVQIPLKKLALGGNEPEADQKAKSSSQVPEILSRINIRTEDDHSRSWSGAGSTRFSAPPRSLVQRCSAANSNKGKGGFGSFRLRSSVKFRKPPLPPSTKPQFRSDDPALKRNDKLLKVHAVDARLEELQKQQDVNSAMPKDLFADFASRLDIREKPTPLGTFHVADRKKLIKSSKKCDLGNALTPVNIDISPKGSVEFCFGSTGVLKLHSNGEASSKASAVGCSGKSLTDSLEGAYQSHRSATRTSFTACCGSSPFPVAGPGFGMSSKTQGTSKDLAEAPCKKVGQDIVEEMSSRTKKRRSEEMMKGGGNERSNPKVSKGSRFSIEGRHCAENVSGLTTMKEAALAGPWLKRWSLRNVFSEEESKEQKVKVKRSNGLEEQKKLVKQAELEAPSAAAMAIVGAAVRELELYS